MLLKRAAILFGIVFLVIGVLGFVPGVTNHEMLLGIFHVNVAHGGANRPCGDLSECAGTLRRRDQGSWSGSRDVGVGTRREQKGATSAGV